MSKYAFAGLTVDSEIPLPELPSSSHANPVDAVVGVGDVCVPPAHDSMHVWRDPLDKVAFVSGRVQDDWYIEFPGALKVLIAPDGGVTVQPDAGIAETTLQHLLIDQILPRALTLRGHALIHAAAASTPGGRNVLLLGDSGAGKSTLSGAIALAGGTLHADDCIRLLGTPDGEMRMIGAYPGLRAWPDTVARVFGNNGTRSREMAGHSSKRRLDAPTESAYGAPEWRTLHAVYILQLSTAGISITRASGIEACMALVANAFKLDLKEPLRNEGILKKAAKVANCVPVMRLAYPRHYELLPDVVAELENSAGRALARMQDLRDLD